MPIFRYFIFVGGALLALLFAAGFVWPDAPTAPVIATAGVPNASDQPMIRIRSDRHLPERVVFDTSQPPVAGPTMTAAAAGQPEQDGSPALADLSAKSQERGTLAQLTPASAKGDAAAASKAEAKTEAKTHDAKPHLAQAPVHPKRKLARARPLPQRGPQMMLMAQQPRFGLFDMTW